MILFVRNLVVAFIAVVVTSVSYNPSTAFAVPNAAADETVSRGRKTVTVYADNEASASAQAAKQNPGWTVEKVSKVSKDPKSRAYQVTLSN